MSVLQQVGQAISYCSSQQVRDWPVLAILHATWVAWNFRRSSRTSRPYPLEALVATWILSFGGTTLTAIILGNPWGWIQAPHNFLIYTIIPLSIYFAPNDFVYLALERVSFVLAPILICADLISKTISITSNGVDAVKLHSSGNLKLQNSPFACILCGLLSGCGGGLIGSLIGIDKGHSWTFNTPNQFLNPNVSLVMAFIGACTYWIGTNIGSIYSSTVAIQRNEAVGLTFLAIAGFYCVSNLLTPTSISAKAVAVRKNSRKRQ